MESKANVFEGLGETCRASPHSLWSSAHPIIRLNTLERRAMERVTSQVLDVGKLVARDRKFTC